MKTINLIPSPRRDARRRHAHRGRCAVTCVAYGLVASAAVAACQVAGNLVAPSLAEPLADAETQVEQSGKVLAAVRAELDASQATLTSSRAIAEQPDWGTLLALLAAKAGDEVVLGGCNVRPRDEPRLPAPDPKKPAAKAAPAADPVMVVAVVGRGRSQRAVSQFVLRLEATGLFGKVALVDTTRDPAGGSAVGFRVDASLDDPGPVPARRTAATRPAKSAGRVATKPATAAAEKVPTPGAKS